MKPWNQRNLGFFGLVQAICVILALTPTALAADKPWPALPPVKTVILPLVQVHAGMRGVAYTVFEGTQPEPMEVEVLGILKNNNGPRGDVILVRLHGTKAEYTGVVAGMSGSPVYFDGKLAGALAFRIGQFSKEPIGGVTPIEEMLEINAIDKSREASPASKTASNAVQNSAVADSTNVSSAAQSNLLAPIVNQLQPIETPLVFNGFSQDAIQQFAHQFASAGIVPVMGAGSVSDKAQPEPILPGSAVSMVLVRGDMDIAATCTVTYIDPQRLLACGHPVLQFGAVDIPMNKAEVLATLASPLNAFKIVNTTEPAGAFVQDRQKGILGLLGKQPEMIPVTLTLSGTTNLQYHFEVLSNPRLSAVAIMSTVFNALHSINQYGEDVSYRMSGKIQVDGFPDVAVGDIFAPNDGGQPAAMSAALAVGERFDRIFGNPYDAPKVKGVNLKFELSQERLAAHIESARSNQTEVRPGDQIMIETVLRPFRGEPVIKQVPVRIPASVPRGTLRILVSEGDLLDRIGRGSGAAGKPLDLSSTIAQINKDHANNRIYASVLAQNPQAIVDDKVMPALPLSILNVMDAARGPRDLQLMGESAVGESATVVDYAVTGAQLVTVTVK